MAENFKPRKRGETVNIRLTRIQAACGTGAALSGLLLGGTVALGTSQFAQSSGSFNKIMLDIICLAIGFRAANFFMDMLILASYSAFLAKRNPKKFSKILNKKFSKSFKEMFAEEKRKIDRALAQAKP